MEHLVVLLENMRQGFRQAMILVVIFGREERCNVVLGSIQVSNVKRCKGERATYSSFS
jgi:hypothetical protein